MKILFHHPKTCGVVVSVVTLLAGASALILADFGAPLVLFLPLFVWIATIGLPSTLGVLLAAALWGRTAYASGFYGFVGVAALLALALQVTCFLVLRRCLAGKRKMSQCE